MSDGLLAAGALRYVYDLNNKTHLFGEVGGWHSPTGTYRFSRLYANGAGTATGIDSSGTRSYVFGRFEAAFDVTPDDEVALSGELGHPMQCSMRRRFASFWQKKW